MTDFLDEMIQQSQALQGYRPFDVRELGQVKKAWARSLKGIPVECLPSAFDEAFRVYTKGRFRPSAVRLIYEQAQKIEKRNLDLDIYREVQQLAELTLRDEDRPMKFNILRPISEWLETRRPPRPLWQQEVINAVTRYDRADKRRRVAANDGPAALEVEVPEREDKRLSLQAGS